MRALLLVKDRKNPFSEDVIVNETGAMDTNLGTMAKVSSFFVIPSRIGSYELVYQLSVQLTLSAVQVNVDVTWSRNQVLLSNSTCPV